MTDLEALAALARHLPATADPELRKWLGAQQKAATIARWQRDAPIIFTWRGGRSFELNEEPIRAGGVGLLLAWLVIAGYQHRLQGAEPAAVLPGQPRADARALQAMQRAAMRVPEPLAGCLRAIGTDGGVLTVKAALPCTVTCESPELVRAVTQASAS